MPPRYNAARRPGPGTQRQTGRHRDSETSLACSSGDAASDGPRGGGAGSARDRSGFPRGPPPKTQRRGADTPAGGTGDPSSGASGEDSPALDVDGGDHRHLLRGPLGPARRVSPALPIPANSCARGAAAEDVPSSPDALAVHSQPPGSAHHFYADLSNQPGDRALSVVIDGEAAAHAEPERLLPSSRAPDPAACNAHLLPAAAAAAAAAPLRRGPRNPITSMASRKAAQDAADDAGIGPAASVQQLIATVSPEALDACLKALDPWSGGETIPYIPLKNRNDLTDVFSGLLSGMVKGSTAASKLLCAFPKLVLHRTSVKPKSAKETGVTVGRRTQMFLRGEIRELLTEITREKAAGTSAASKKRSRDENKQRLHGVRALARAGALSKAVKRLTGQLAHYEPEVALKWAKQLIPNPPEGSTGLGATPISVEEQAALSAVRTAATPERADDEEEDAAAPAASADAGAAAPAASADADAAVPTDGAELPPAAEGSHPAPPRRTPPNSAPPPVFRHNEGVRFGALSAPGPSGLRPEHLHAFATCRRSKSRHGYDQAMRLFVSTAIRGALPLAAWWITGSSLTFTRKKGAGPNDAPRPLRVGEVLRRCVAKRVAAAEKLAMRRLFVRRRQFGVACPGGAEVLIHHRMQTITTAKAAAGDDCATWDADISNCFGSLLWTAVDESVRKHIPGALPWTRWCHSNPVRVVLPGGASYTTERGAEQGDPLGSAYAAAVIADVCERTHAMAADMRSSLTGKRPNSAAIHAVIATQRRAFASTLPANLQPCLALLPAHVPSPDADAVWDQSPDANTLVAGGPPRVADVWYIDDSYVRADALDGDLWFAAWDLLGAAVGAKRSTTKSLVRGGRPNAAIPPYSAATCTRTPHDAPVKWLGIRAGQEVAQLREEVAKAGALHDAIAALDDPALVLVLTRATADVCRIVHLLRAVGPPLNAEPLNDFDELMADAVARVVRSDISDEAAEQATWGVRAGGLGLRKATATGLPAHVASLVECEPLVAWLTCECEKLGVSPGPAEIAAQASTSARASAAINALLESIAHEKTRGAVRHDIDEARVPIDPSVEPAILRDRPRDADRPPPRPPPPGDIVPDASGDTRESSSTPARAGLQHRILAHLDNLHLHRHLDPLRSGRAKLSKEQTERLLRLEDIAHNSTHHDWLWSINPAHGPVLSPEEYITAVRLRLGVPVASYEGTRRCGGCNTPQTAAQLGSHALLCTGANGKRVIGHDRLRDHLHTLVRASDPRARVEVPLGDAPRPRADAASQDEPDVHRQRPADILLSVSPFKGGAGGPLAVDVGIVAPHTLSACNRVSPAEDYRKRKVVKSADACAAAGWTLLPFLVSAYGKPHADAEQLVNRLCTNAAREFVVEPAARLEANWWRNATTLLMARAAAMVARCRPVPDFAHGLDGSREEMRGVEPHKPLPRTSPAYTLADAVVVGVSTPPIPAE